MTDQPLTPCTCEITVKRDRRLLSRTTIVVDNNCPMHCQKEAGKA